MFWNGIWLIYVDMHTWFWQLEAGIFNMKERDITHTEIQANLEILCPFAVLRFDWYKEHDMHRLSEQQAEQKTVKQFHLNAWIKMYNSVSRFRFFIDCYEQ